MNNKPIYVTFGDKKIEKEFESLKEGKFEDKQLYDFIDRAIIRLKVQSGLRHKDSKKFMAKRLYQKIWHYQFMEIWFAKCLEIDLYDTNK